MASIYAGKTTGTGVGYDSVRPLGFDAVSYNTLMIDTKRSPNCLVLSPDDTITAASLQRLVTAPTKADLKVLLQATNPSASERNALDTFAKGGSMQPLTAAQVTWWDCLVYLAQQVNPAADLNVTFS